MTNEEVGIRLRERRLELLLTQKEVADFLHVTEATVSRWESGKVSNMSRNKIFGLAEILKISPLVILGEDVPAEGEYQPTNTRIVKLYRSLSTEGKTIFNGVLKALSQTYSAK